MLSYWEKESFIRYDYIIVGSGIVGLSTAISLKEQQPDKSVLVLERGMLPTGASTKNAGFACIGSLTEILDDLQVMTTDEVLALVEMRQKGLMQLRKRLGDAQIDYRENGSYELLFDKDLAALERMKEINQLLYAVTNKDTYETANSEITSFGFGSSVRALVKNHCEGQLHTGKMMRALLQKAAAVGVMVLNGCEVTGFEPTQKHVSVTARGNTAESIIFQCRKLAFCTNAFTQALLPEESLVPGRGQVIVTSPIPNLKVRGIFHFDQGYYYFRNVSDRILFGGGRNMAMEEEQTTRFEVNERIVADLLQKLEDIILPGVAFQVAQKWSGIMAFGKTKQPIIKKVDERVFAGIRMGGMGVAVGSYVGDALCSLLIKA